MGAKESRAGGEQGAAYAADVKGEIIGYESALPGVDSALLVRSEEKQRSIGWRTEVLEPGPGVDLVRLVWLFGINATPEQHEFELLCGGEFLLRFKNPTSALLTDWEVAGEGDARLRFRPTRVDRHADLFGFAELELPVAHLTPGEPIELELRGESAGSPVWCMTFRHAPESSAQLAGRAALMKGADGPWQPVRLDLVHLGEPTRARIETSWGVECEVELELGANSFSLPHPEVRCTTAVSVELEAEDGTTYQLGCELAPVRPWVVHLVQHTHTDLGYTRPQSEILPDHLRYIDYALDYCDLTDGFPEEARFRWTCEAAWPVREWLRCRPAMQIERLKQRVAEGRIELTAMFANLSEILDEAGAAASLEPLRAMGEHGLPVEVAMQDDINGIHWCFADLLPPLGVRILVMGEHGHRALIPFDVPTAFWWESPSGSRLLCWRPDHYNTGNFFGVHSGDPEQIEDGLFNYLQDLEQKDYPHDLIAVQYSGVFLDNAPPGIKANELIERWNERYLSPRLRSATVSELPNELEAARGAELPVHRAAWPDWWSDGIGSAPRETAAARRCQAELRAVEGLFALARLLGTELPAGALERLQSARERLVFHAEHTYGAAESVREPGAENSQVQWAQKAAHVWSAVQETALSKEVALGLLQEHWPRSERPGVVVTNSLGWSRSGSACCFIDRELLPTGRAFRLLDEDGERVPMQLERAGHDGNWWRLWAADLPAFGWRCYELELLDSEAQAPPASRQPRLLENEHCRLLLDPARGGLASLFDKLGERELVDGEDEHGFGQLVHERLGNRWQLERRRLDDFSRTSLVAERVQSGAGGPIWQSSFLRGPSALSAPNSGFEVEVRLHELEPKVEFIYRLRKRPETAPEALYAAFPFDLPGARMTYETAGGEVDPRNQLLPRTSSDWQAVQSHIALRDKEGQVCLSSPDVLLYHLGSLNLGRFREAPSIERSRVYAWLFNNYWVTNFLASQEGALSWSQAIRIQGESGRASRTRRAWSDLTPLVARVRPAAATREVRRQSRAGLELQGAEVLLSGARPAAGGALLLHLREIGGSGGELRATLASGSPARLQRADCLGRPLGPEGERILVPALGALHLLLHP